MRKVRPNKILVLHNVTIVPSNVRKKKGTTECDKSIVTCDISTAQFEDDIIKCEKKICVQPNVAKVRLNLKLVLSNVTMKPSNVKIKNKKK